MKHKESYVNLTDKNFRKEVLESQKLVLVVFEADWSGACHIIAPIIENLTIDYRDEIKVGKLNTDEFKQIPKEYGIWEIPTILNQRL